MAVHAVCETTNLRATHYAERIWDAVSTEDVDNGTFGYLDGVETEGGVIYNFVKGTKEGAPVVMAHNPEWTEDTSRMTNQRKDKFFIPAGVVFRAYTLHNGDEMALSAEGFEGTPEIGKYVSIGTSGKLVVADAPVEGAVMVGKIMRKRQIGSVLKTGIRDYGYARMMYTVKVETLA
ncbi:MAG: hypothetical protein J6R59_10795 [Paludibacteraceae bacterium]|nr:hypothetical protein [Paludibacteraceae bacterium]